MVIGITASMFDLFHSGHIKFLEQCRERCDYLIVALQVRADDRPEKNKPIQSIYERYLQVQACKYVDKIIPYDNEKDLELILKMENYNVRFLGDDYLGKEFTGKEFCEEYKKIIYIPRKHNLSTSSLREKVYLEEVKKRRGNQNG